MNQIISKIYPKTKNSRYAVDSVYLRKRLIFKKNHDKPMYYANFLTSLDGRIATYNNKYKQLLTPQSIKNNVDFQLFCQLQAQADCLITNTHYMKGLDIGYYGDILSTKDQKLKKWRKENNLYSQKIIILSNSLNFPISDKTEKYKEEIIVLTTSKNKNKIKKFQSNGYKILKFSGKNISAKQLDNFIVKNKFNSIYFIAGPTIVEQFISKNLLDKLYYSTSIRMIGTTKYDTIIRGNFLKKAVNLKLSEMYIYEEKGKINEQTLFQIFNAKEE
jgi:riboflavin biosynthesis pyrimidine reductase|tara:strand:- start:93 stop:914 length:822 start_codon:yes stop_codon:yes gene_type:complete